MSASVISGRGRSTRNPEPVTGIIRTFFAVKTCEGVEALFFVAGASGLDGTPETLLLVGVDALASPFVLDSCKKLQVPEYQHLPCVSVSAEAWIL
jgi:hypothetical protein